MMSRSSYHFKSTYFAYTRIFTKFSLKWKIMLCQQIVLLATSFTAKLCQDNRRLSWERCQRLSNIVVPDLLPEPKMLHILCYLHVFSEPKMLQHLHQNECTCSLHTCLTRSTSAIFCCNYWSNGLQVYRKYRNCSIFMNARQCIKLYGSDCRTSIVFVWRNPFRYTEKYQNTL